jgi:hypothetical protein
VVLIQHFATQTEHINDMVVTDIDADGKHDIAIRHLDNRRVRILFQDSWATNTWTLKTIDVDPREGLAVADLDGDNKKDLLLNGFWLKQPASNPRGGTWTRYEIDAAFNTQDDTGLNNAARTETGQFNTSGLTDALISGAEGQSTTFSLYLNPGTPTSTAWTEVVLEANSGTGMHNAIVGDVNGDGQLEVLNGFAFGSTGVRAYYLNTNGTLNSTQVITTAQGLYTGALGNFDGSGRFSLMGANTYNGQVYFYRNLGVE